MGDVVSVSKNVFLPLTNLCRDRCGYCTFAVQPDSPDAKTYTLDEVADVVRGGLRAGCREALFCLGDKPEVAYKSHREWLAARGLATTAEYLEQACQVAFELGMLPHTNAGILSADEMVRLRRWNASATRSNVASSRWRPSNCSPTGSPPTGAQGIDTPGAPTRFAVTV